MINVRNPVFFTVLSLAIFIISSIFVFSYFKQNSQKNYNSVIENKIIKKEEICEIKKKLHLVGNVDHINDQFFLDAKHIAKFANYKLKNLKNLKNLIPNYLKPQYIINNYIA